MDSMLHEWKSDTLERSGAMPHIKTYARFRNLNYAHRQLQWFILTSSNIRLVFDLWRRMIWRGRLIRGLNSFSLLISPLNSIIFHSIEIVYLTEFDVRVMKETQQQQPRNVYLFLFQACQHGDVCVRKVDVKLLAAAKHPHPP